MINNVVLMGRICQDLELRTTASGVSVTSFNIAVERNYQRQGEEKQTDFLTVVCWKSTADFITRYFRKGSMIAVQGSIQTRSFEDKQGNKRTAVEVVADNVSFCGSKAEQGSGASAFPPVAAAASPSLDVNYSNVEDDEDDEDLPF